MKKINELEAILAGTTSYKDSGVAWDTVKAYRHSVETGNKRMDFSDISRTDEIPQVVADLRRFGIKEFSVSEQSTALMRALAAFEASGCKVTKMTLAKDTSRAWDTNEFPEVPAIKLLVK